MPHRPLGQLVTRYAIGAGIYTLGLLFTYALMKAASRKSPYEE